MKQKHYQAVVIGGGVIGCSVLYHLAKGGWKDLLLIERKELTSGSSWHAAGGMHTLNSDPYMAKLQDYTIEVYKELEEISGQSCSLHMTGGLMMAGTNERMDYLRSVESSSRHMNIEAELISVEEAAKLFPLMDKKHFKGALYESKTGHGDPSGVTQAYAACARKLGAEIVRQNQVTALKQRPDASWEVITEQGNIIADHVVNAAGLWAREVGRMVGLELPVLAMEHMYLLTDRMPELLEHNEQYGEIVHLVDFEGELYTRQEADGMLLGTYERACVPWQPKQTPWDFGHELLEPDLDRIWPSLEVAFAHFPCYEKAGIRKVINGPFTFAPDGNPLVGPVLGLKNYWCACAVMAGFSQGGGVGLALSNWMINGDPGTDTWAMDLARFGDWTSPLFTNAKVRENYSRRFQISYPNEHRPAGRPLRTSPLYAHTKAENAVMGFSYGQEVPLFYQKEGLEAIEEPTFSRSSAFERVAEEVACVRQNVGICDITGFAKYEVAGSRAQEWLLRILANRLPKKNRLILSPMLNPNGNLIGDFTVACLAHDRYMIFGSGIAEQYHLRWFEQNLFQDGVSVRALGSELCGISVSGPKSRALLQELTTTDLGNEAYPFMHFNQIYLGMFKVLLGRISFSGDLGYEVWVDASCAYQLYELLRRTGEEFNCKPYGLYAMNSMRLEKSYGSWASEYRPIFSPSEAGLDAFVRKSDRDFIGAEAVMKAGKMKQHRLIVLKVHGNDIDALGNESVIAEDQTAGWVTSGGYAHHSQVSIALAYVREPWFEQREFEVEILLKRYRAERLFEPVFDPLGKRMRS